MFDKATVFLWTLLAVQMHLRCHPYPQLSWSWCKLVMLKCDTQISCYPHVCCMLYDLLDTLRMADGSLPWIMSHEPLSGYRQSHHRGLAPGYSSSSMSPVSSIHATPSLKLSFHNGNSIWLLNFIIMSKMLVPNENALWRQWTNWNPGDMTLFWSRDTPCKMHRLLLFSPASDTKMFQALLSAFVWA